jgi:hypothetical protein
MRTSLQIAWIHAGTYVFWKLSLAHADGEVDLEPGHVCCHVSRGLFQAQIKW